MGFKDLINKGKCLIGLHQGEWRAASRTSCTFTRVCERCGVEQSKVEHLWPEWGFSADASCQQMRTCNRCGLQEERIYHTWAEAVYKTKATCEQEQVCRRCREARPAPVKHVMDRWRYVGADSCTQVQQCSRCQTDGVKHRVEHSWGDWQHSNAHNGPLRVCRRCGEMQVQAQPGAVKAPPPTAPPAGMSRKEMFEALNPKMQMLAEQQAAMERVLGAVSDRLVKRQEAPDEEENPPAPLTVTDDEVADLIARADAAEGSGRSLRKRDARLEGHWRCTPPALSSGGYSLSTDIHLVLDAEGRFARWSRSIGPAGETKSEPEYGSWRSPDGRLVLSYDDGEESVRTYEVHPRELLFPQGGNQAYWQRVG